MLDHPQDAYRLAKDKQKELQEFRNNERLLQSNNERKKTGKIQEISNTIQNLSKIQIEVKLKVKNPKPESGRS